MSSKYSGIVEPLINYSCETYNELSEKELGNIRLIYEIIRQAIVDLHSNDAAIVNDAKQYFNGELFKQHCAYVAIKEETMLYIAHNPNKYILEDTINNESNF